MYVTLLKLYTNSLQSPTKNPLKKLSKCFLPPFRLRTERRIQESLHILSMAARNALLKHFRVNARLSQQPLLQNPKGYIGGVFSSFLRRQNFSEEVKGSFLDKSEVTDRVVTVVKNFQKVEPSKVRFTV